MRCLSCYAICPYSTCSECGFNRERMCYEWVTLQGVKVHTRTIHLDNLYQAVNQHHKTVHKSKALEQQDVFLENPVYAFKQGVI